MASIVISGDTSGSITVSAPDVAGSNTISLPATTGTMALTSQISNFKNRIINGAMVIDQRNAGASVTGNDGVFCTDRFSAGASQTSKFTMQQVTDAPTGFNYSLKATSSSAYTVGASELFEIRQNIEGYNVADLGFGTANAKTITLSFWVKSSLTGTFGGSLSNDGLGRSYPFTYTISSANTWTQATVVITGCLDGTWLTTNGVGLRVRFSLGAGSTYQGTAGAWANAYYTNATGATSVVGTSGATFYITGVQLEEGTTATSFEREAYSVTLQKCQRYFYTLIRGTGYFVNAYYYSSSNLSAIIQFPNQMRATPTLTVNSGTNYYVFYRNGGNDSVNSFSISSPSTTASGIENTTEASGTAGQAGGIYADNANCFIGFSAEL